MDCGISEFDFWDMTIAELDRAIASKTRVKIQEEKERASFDYILAVLISRGVQNAVSGGDGIPDIAEVYPGLFDEALKEKQAQKQAKQDQLSVLRFKQFANSYNKRFSKNEEVQKVNE